MPNRRTVLQTSLGIAAAVVAGTGRAWANEAPIATTTSGKVRGASAGGVQVFKGIPYGASTAGADRFMPPRKARAVDRRARRNGLCRPLAAGAERPAAAGAVAGLGTGRHAAGRRGLPDPARLDAGARWRQAAGDDLAARRRLLVRLGQLAALRRHEPRPQARRRARRVNHRLTIFGHLDLSAVGGERFAQSGNVGVLDLVAALEWVRDNAAQCGGNSGNVTIFGQSGGGGKVSALLAMPSAKGLFHKAIIESGAVVRFAEPERTTRLAEAVLKHYRLGPNDVDKLQALPFAKLQEAIVPAQKTLPKPRYPLLDRYNFGPVIDGRVLPAHPYDPAATAESCSGRTSIRGTGT